MTGGLQELWDNGSPRARRRPVLKESRHAP
jgi:hypothetical protein